MTKTDPTATAPERVRKFYALRDIAVAPDYADVDVRRLAALSALPAKAISALRQGRLNLRQAKLLARLSDKQAQTELAEVALSGHGFPEWRVNELLDEGAITARDRRFALVGAQAYAEAGGRTVCDLFGERADVLLDAEILQELWTKRADAFAETLRCEGLAVQETGGPPPAGRGGVGRRERKIRRNIANKTTPPLARTLRCEGGGVPVTADRAPVAAEDQ